MMFIGFSPVLKTKKYVPIRNIFNESSLVFYVTKDCFLSKTGLKTSWKNLTVKLHAVNEKMREVNKRMKMSTHNRWFYAKLCAVMTC